MNDLPVSSQTTEIKEKPQKNYLPIILIFILLATTVFLAYQNYLLTNEVKTYIQKIPSDNSKLLSPTQTPAPSLNYYQFKIKLKSQEKNPTEDNSLTSVLEYLRNNLRLSKELNFLIYDVREGDPYKKGSSPINLNYFIYLPSEEKIDMSKSYGDELTTIEINSIEKSLEPYLSNTKYCEKDSDCVIRYETCTYGSFNYFADLFLGGCGPPDDESGYTFLLYDEKIGCETNVTYSGSKCIQNKCVAQGRKVFCK